MEINHESTSFLWLLCEGAAVTRAEIIVAFSCLVAKSKKIVELTSCRCVDDTVGSSTAPMPRRPSFSRPMGLGTPTPTASTHEDPFAAHLFMTPVGPSWHPQPPWMYTSSLPPCPDQAGGSSWHHSPPVQMMPTPGLPAVVTVD